jgi:protocatechuate 3,4-dioxygenase beta subunit
MKKIINLLLISIILLSLTAVTGAQASGTPFSISGQIVDRYGNPLSGADVTLIDNNYKAIGSKKTNENGNYDFVNVVADTDTCTVRVSYTDPDGKKYDMPTYYVLWYPTKGMQFIPSKQTLIPNYPQPTYGYLYGAIQTDMSTNGKFINGIVYLVSLDNDVKYYEFADRTDGKGSFAFYVPPGPYMLYAQHWENGVAYESSHKQVTVGRNADIAEVLETRIILPLNNPTNDPDPAIAPEHQNNRVNGTVLTKDGKPVSGATVTLLEKSDNMSNFITMKGTDGNRITTTTNENGNYEFYGVVPTTDDGKSIQSKKDIKVMVEYTGADGTKQTITAENRDARALYYPDMIMGYGAENAARNIALPSVTLPYAKGGWVSLTSVPTGAYIFIDGQQLFGPDNKPLVTPTTAYIDPGTHEIKMSRDGYSDSADTITMEANKQHTDFIMSLQKSVVPAWVTAAVAIIILLIVVVVVVVLLATRIKFLLAPVMKIFGGLGHRMGDMKASRDISKAHKAEAAELKRIEQLRKAEDKMAARRDSIRKEDAPGPRSDVNVVNVDPVKRKQADEVRKPIEGARKKILDIDFKHLTDSVPKKIKPRETDAPKEKSSVVFANDIYKKTSGDVERYEPASRSSYEQPAPRAQPVSDREALVERPNAPERSDRFKIPRISGQREPGSSLGDRERVLRYIREHAEGVSFIQMSNDLEIIPNTLTYITKELVINDDIEKIKGLYYYKSHASPSEDSSSSVVVWRLDGDK